MDGVLLFWVSGTFRFVLFNIKIMNDTLKQNSQNAKLAHTGSVKREDGSLPSGLHDCYNFSTSSDHKNLRPGSLWDSEEGLALICWQHQHKYK